MQTGYRRFSKITDIGGIKSAIGEMRGLGYPKQPVLNKDARAEPSNDNYHIFIYGCALCATRVPCESQVPAARQKNVPTQVPEKTG